MEVGDGVYYRMQHHQGNGDLGDVAPVENRAESLPPEAKSFVDDVKRETCNPACGSYMARSMIYRHGRGKLVE